jgi:[glutamine synthetase] adenylyltransferase / [glutamine synthetase]-adenylyl-L-tyrosine phosphorylase
MNPQDIAQRAWEKYSQSCTDSGLPIPSNKQFQKEAPFVFELSQFTSNFAIRYPAEFNELVNSGDLFRTDHYHPHYAIEIKKHLRTNPTEMAFNQFIRLYRQKESVRIAWQHFLLKDSFERLALEISVLANTLIQATHDYYFNQLSTELNLADTPPQMLILGMGKLGANELNFSSDVDLIFFYHQDTKFKAASGKEILSLRFYTRLGQKIINSLHQLQPSGFVYRVDMRLRPFGNSGPLAMSLKAFNDYCHKHGRDWERYAMIKARCITGEAKHQAQLKEIIHGFVYRPYHDYKMGDAIRKMKQKIISEMKKTHNNIKLGRGGIREVEFITQSYQLTYGGQNILLTVPHLKQATYALVYADLISKEDADTLYKNYVFLRNVENSLQMLKEQQTHTLPESRIDQTLVAQSLGIADWKTLFNQIECTRQEIQTLFDQLTHFTAESKSLPSVPSQKNTITTESLPKETLSTLPEKGTLSDLIFAFKARLSKGKYPEESLSLIYDLLPTIELTVLSHAHWDQEDILTKALRFLKKIIRRTTYLYLLHERQANVGDWLSLIQLGERFASLLERHPFLLERALMHRYKNQLYLQQCDFSDKLTQVLKHIDSDNKEDLMEATRRFQLRQLFNIAVAKCRGKITLMESSDVMSALAESIIIEVLHQAWVEVFQHEPLSESEQLQLQQNLSIIAYGKLGGLELGFTSDLDIIFLYSEKDIIKSHEKYFTRAAQRFVSLMQAHTYTGKLYEIDLRLRPEGSSGLLVSSISAFERYQEQSAWTWEHQALVRARWVTGSPHEVLQRFESVRQQLLIKPRDKKTLQNKIVEMRLKMRSQLLGKHRAFDVKQSPGGMVDIEFIAQFFALYDTPKYAQISFYTDNIRIFESMETAGLLSIDETSDLINSYCYYRDLAYHCYFNSLPAIVEYERVAGYPEKVLAVWDKYLLNTSNS